MPSRGRELRFKYMPWTEASRLRILVTPVFALFALSIFGISLIPAGLVVLVLIVVYVFGRQVLSFVGYEQPIAAADFAVGIISFVFCGQLLLHIGVPPGLAHWSTIAAMAIGAAAVKKSFSAPLNLSQNGSRSTNLLALQVALSVTTLRHPWLLPFTIASTLVVTIFLRKRSKSAHFLIAVVLLVFGYAVSLSIRPDKWWYFYSDNDEQFFEALGWSIARWGIFEHPGFVGGSIAAYHWLTYAFFGGLTELAQLAPWSAQRILGPLLIHFMIAKSVMDALPTSRKVGLWKAMILLFVVWMTRGQVADSWAFSIVIAFSFLEVSARGLKSNWFRQVVFWTIFSFGLIFAKVSTAAVVALILMLVMLAEHRRNVRPNPAPLLCLLFAGSTVVFTFRNSASAAASSINPPKITDMPNLGSFFRSVVAFDSLLPNLTIWALYFVVVRHSNQLKIGLSHRTIAALTPPCLLLSLFYQDIEFKYFLYTVLFLLTIYCGKAILQGDYFKRPPEPTSLHYALLLSLGFGLISGLAWRQLKLGLYLEQVLSITSLNLIILGVALGSATFFVLKMAVSLNLGRVLLMFAIIIGVHFSFQFQEFFQMKQRGTEYYSMRENTESNFGTKDLISVGEFVRKSTDQQIILASNNFMPDRLNGGANFLLPVETQRRFLVQGLRFQTGQRDPSDEQLSRMRLSIEFADKPSSSSLNELKKYGVGGFIVNLSLTDQENWTEFAVELFRSGNFVYLQLK